MTFCHLDKTKQPQLLCDFLMEIGACSTCIVDADRGTFLEQAIYREPAPDAETTWIGVEQNAAIIREDAAVGQNVWNRCNVTAHFPASADLQLVADMVSETLELPLVQYTVQVVPNRDWVVHVQKSWKPIMISGLVLRFPWHTSEDVQNVVGNSEVNKLVELQLEGGIAFGTGEHPTTQLCLLWIQTLLLKQDSTITNFLDYGTGSGVLGLAACALSKNRVKAVGVDIDVDAVRIANANAATNGGLAMKSYLPPLKETKDSETKSLLMKAHSISNSEILPNDGMLYDACVANILAAPLVVLAPTLASMIKPNGYLGLSGILEPQAEMIIEAYSEFFDNVHVENAKGGWILVTGRRKA
jgi:ribosomal protein L11 methyltransferase